MAGIVQLKDPGLPPARRVQKGRQATKAAAALLLMPPAGFKPMARGLLMALAGARRSLATLRDGDALIETLEQLAAQTKCAERPLLAIRKRLSERQVEDPRRRAEEIDRAVALLTRIARQIEGLEPSRDDPKRLARQIARNYRAMRRGIGKALADHDIELLHSMRKQVIIHRHQLAFLASLTARPSLSKALISRERATKSLGVLVGTHRDLHLLDEALRPLGTPALRTTVEALLGTINRLQDDLLADAADLARRLTRRKGKDLARLIRAGLDR